MPEGGGPRVHLGDVRQRLLVQKFGRLVSCFARRDNNDRQCFVDERVWSVLHLTGGVAFGVDVRNFFQFQGPFHGNRIVSAAPEEECMMLVGKALGPRLDFGFEA